MSLPIFGKCSCDGGLPVTPPYSLTIGNAIANGDPATDYVNVSESRTLNLTPGVVYRIEMAFGFPATSLAPFYCANGTGRVTVTDAEAAATDRLISTDFVGSAWHIGADGLQAGVESSLFVVGSDGALVGFFSLGAPDSGYTSISEGSANTGVDLGTAPVAPPLAGFEQNHLVWDARNLIRGTFNGQELLITAGRITTYIGLGPCATSRAITLRYTYSVGKEQFPFDASLLEISSYMLIHAQADPNTRFFT